jgi:hypothetical protein
MASDKHEAYETEYESSPQQKANRAARGRARYYMMKHLGERAIAGKDVDHIKALKGGGSPTAHSNLRVRSIHANRGDKTY